MANSYLGGQGGVGQVFLHPQYGSQRQREPEWNGPPPEPHIAQWMELFEKVDHHAFPTIQDYRRELRKLVEQFFREAERRGAEKTSVVVVRDALPPQAPPVKGDNWLDDYRKNV